ncbi:energy transducer TonB, partial [Hymenobacter agri]
QVLAHELAHVRQHHTADRLLLELLRVALWFNPFVHLCARALALTHEYLADAAALHEPASPVPSVSLSYSQLLARQVASRLGFPVPLAHSFSHSQTLSRIAMMQKTHPVRRWKQWLALPLLGVLLVAVACERGTDAVTPAGKTPAEISQYNSQHKPNGFYEGDIPPPPPPTISNTPAPAADPKVYTYVEQMPQLPGGGNAQAIMQYLQSHIKYSEALAANPKEGSVFASFTVTKDGNVSDAKIVKGLSPDYDAAVLQAVQTMPRFIPGRQDGQVVAVSFTVPVRFAVAPTNK